MAGKAQDMCQRHTLMGGEGGSRVRDIARPLLRNFGAKSSERSFPKYFKQIGHSFLYTTI